MPLAFNRVDAAAELGISPRKLDALTRRVSSDAQVEAQAQTKKEPSG